MANPNFDFNNFLLYQGTLTVDPANFSSFTNSPRPLTPFTINSLPFTLIITKASNSQKLQQIVICEEGLYVYTRIYTGSSATWSLWTPAT